MRKRPGAVVDVSNVCWSKGLPPVGRKFPLLDRLFLVRDAWREQYGAGAPVGLVGDNSLLRSLLPEDRARLQRLRQDPGAEGFDEVRFVPYADPVFLRLARERGRHVISSDLFTDLRRAEPWIEEQPQRVLAWSTDADDRVRLRPSAIVPLPAHRVSKAIQVKDLKYLRLLDPDHRDQQQILRSHWRCTAIGCDTALHWPDGLLGWPTVSSGGRAVCDCGSLLERLGPRGVTRSFVVSDATAPDLPGGLSAGEFLRFPVSVGDAVQLGRGALRHGLNLAAKELPSPPGVKRVSRAHLVVSLERAGDTPQAYAVDLGSGNGTVVVRESGATRRVEPGERVAFGVDDRLVLGDAVAVRMSGQLHFTAEQTLPPDLGAGGEGTTLLGWDGA
ncbi:FHA domain-containing protein [Streptomyces sp. NRRL WC-3742]|uniref:FHA domain-containing protein n=1 Tax=Streptomyces sp. NRRL WC-3742 TaxID=1463934 RepID=UPI0004C78A63|nr:FHA domain-containing protein [Streptomyces sp. NRRL WC-3742]